MENLQKYSINIQNYKTTLTKIITMKKLLKIVVVFYFLILCFNSIASIPMNSTFKDGFHKIHTKDKHFEYQVNARIQFDHAVVTDHNSTVTKDNVDSQVRRARLAFKVKLHEKWSGEFDFEVDNGKANPKDIFLAYKRTEEFKIQFGNHKVASLLDKMTSSKHHAFLEESSLGEAFGIGRKLGISTITFGEKYFFMASAYGDESDEERSDTTKAERFGYSARGVIRYQNSSKSKVIAVGGSYGKFLSKPSSTAGEDKLEFDANLPVKPYEGDGKDAKVNLAADGKYANIMGLELTVMYNNFIIQSEYAKAKVKLYSGTTAPTFKGHYVQGVYNLFGNNRRYEMETSETIDMDLKDQSAMEILVRHTSTDLTDSSWSTTMGEKIVDTTIGLNYLVNSNISFRINYVMAQITRVAAEKERVDILGTRVQLTY